MNLVRYIRCVTTVGETLIGFCSIGGNLDARKGDLMLMVLN